MGSLSAASVRTSPSSNLLSVEKNRGCILRKQWTAAAASDICNCKVSLQDIPFLGSVMVPCRISHSSRMFTGPGLADWTRASWFQTQYQLLEQRDYLRFRKYHYFLHVVNDWPENVGYGLDDRKLGFDSQRGHRFFSSPQNAWTAHTFPVPIIWG